MKRDTNLCGQDVPEKASGKTDVKLALEGGYDTKIHTYAYVGKGALFFHYYCVSDTHMYRHTHYIIF